MKIKSDIQKELNESGIQLPASSMPEMQMPDGYFDTLPDSIIAQIQQEDLFDSLPKETPYHVPLNFFNDFDASLFAKIEEDGLLSSLPKTIPYDIPQGYFEKLPIQIFNKIHTTPKSLSPLIFSRGIVARLSLAATLLLFMGIAFKGLINTNSTSSITFAEHKLASVPDEEIHQYLLEHQSEIESSLALESIDDSKIDLQKLETEVFDNTLGNISDEELADYIL